MLQLLRSLRLCRYIVFGNALAFEEACDRLKRETLDHALAPEADWIGRDIRQNLFKTPQGRYYRLLYVVVENEVRVIRVRGPGQPDLKADETA